MLPRTPTEYLYAARVRTWTGTCPRTCSTHSDLSQQTDDDLNTTQGAADIIIVKHTTRTIYATHTPYTAAPAALPFPTSIFGTGYHTAPSTAPSPLPATPGVGAGAHGPSARVVVPAVLGSVLGAGVLCGAWVCWRRRRRRRVREVRAAVASDAERALLGAGACCACA